MRKLKRLVSVVLVLGMLLATMFTINAGEYEASEKVSSELLTELDVSYDSLRLGNFEDNGETYSCIIWIEDVELENAVEAGIEAAEQANGNYSGKTTTSYTYSVSKDQEATLIDVALDENADDEYVQTYIETERETATELYTDNNNGFVAENFKARDISVSYVSKYSPCIFANLSVSKIAELITKDDVKYIGFINNEEALSVDGTNDMSSGDMQKCLDLVRINEGKTNFGVSGAGVKIGQIELACPDKSSVRKNPNYNNTLKKGVETDHPDVVYSIMHTIAPDATYYASGLYSDNTTTATQGNFYEQVEWLLSSGVNIINASFGYRGNNLYNNYDDRARWVDHISYNHDVHFIKSAGNAGATGINSPGMAYNAITVGNTAWTGTYTIDSFSSYNSIGNSRAAQRTYKPDIVAPASCTSYATPIVTGTIALLCELQPILKTQQPIVKSILAASAGTRTIRFVTTDSSFQSYGAGMIDAAAALYIVNLKHYSTSTGKLSVNTVSLTYNMPVSASESYMRVALAYTNNMDLSLYSSHIGIIPNGTIAELGVYVYDPSGNLVAHCPINSTTNGANLKVIQFDTNGISGTYKIEVYLVGLASDGRTTNFGVAWW